MAERKGNDDQTDRRLLNEVITIIGDDDPNDYRIQPTTFVALYKDTAPEFAEVLNNAALVQTAVRYEQKDADAIAAQKRFRKLSARATWAVFVATVTAALLTSLGALQAEGATGVGQNAVDVAALVLGLVALVAGAYAVMLLFQVNGGGLLTRWMSTRAGAETERFAYFNKLLRLVTSAHGSDPRMLLFSLEFFRRYQLGLQQVYYTQRGAQHRQSNDKTLKLGAMAAGILALGSGAAGVLSYFQPQLLPFAAVGLLGSALSAVASRREELNQDERNAERYGRTADVLSHLREKHTEVQRAVAACNTTVLTEYAAAVHEQLSQEHRQWLAQAEAIESAVDKLNVSLEAQRRAQDNAE